MSTSQGAIEYIELPAKDLDRDATFYEQVFGWTFQRAEGGYYMWKDPKGTMGGGMYTAIEPVPSGGPRIYITVDDIDQIVPALEAAGAQITTGKTLIDENIGWWAGFNDPAGNAMYIYQAPPRHSHE